MKRGRPPVPAHLKRNVKMQTRVEGQMAERLYAIARRRRTYLSVLTYEFYCNLIRQFETDEKNKIVVTH